jgi:hypothetical protein
MDIGRGSDDGADETSSHSQQSGNNGWIHLEIVLGSTMISDCRGMTRWDDLTYQMFRLDIEKTSGQSARIPSEDDFDSGLGWEDVLYAKGREGAVCVLGDLKMASETNSVHLSSLASASQVNSGTFTTSSGLRVG